MAANDLFISLFIIISFLQLKWALSPGQSPHRSANNDELALHRGDSLQHVLLQPSIFHTGMIQMLRRRLLSFTIAALAYTAKY